MRPKTWKYLKKPGICVKNDGFWLGLDKIELPYEKKTVFFEKNTTPDDLRIAGIWNIFTASGAWERAESNISNYLVSVKCLYLVGDILETIFL